MSSTRTERLTGFVTWVQQHLTGDEKGEAQIFLDRLLQAFEQGGVKEAGGTLEMRLKKSDGATRFADYVWKPVVLIEMKKRGEDLRKHYRQAFDYWTHLVPNRPRWVVLCNFDEFWVYDFETQMDIPVDRVSLDSLPTGYGSLAFLFPGSEEPIFGNDHQAVTREAAARLTDCFNHLVDRGTKRSLAQRFILQTMVALFSQGIGLLEPYTLRRLLAECKRPSDTYDLLGGLFTQMNSPGRTPGGRYKGVDYFNGGLFAQPAHVELDKLELEALVQAAEYDWSKVRPEIFGTIFERSLERSLDVDERHAFGAHFTHPVDIMKIVGPTIVQPWREQIDGAKTIAKLQQLHYRMQQYKVLDPACGSGNFLYVAYRELKRLETRLFARINEISTAEKTVAQRRIGFVTAQQFFGIDINPFAVELAKVTMMIARKLAIEELHVNENALPLENLNPNFIAGDALVTDEGAIRAWPKVDVIIGNPPFLGAKKLKPERGAEYVQLLQEAYHQAVAGMADYCVYWFRHVHDVLPLCSVADPVSGRAGLVGTQNIRSNKSREGGLDHICKSGTIVEAVQNQPWSGEANVHVSIVNWVKGNDESVLGSRKLWVRVNSPQSVKSKRARGSVPATKQYELDCRNVAFISSSLSDDVDVSGALRLSCNKESCYTGQYPRHEGFMIAASIAQRMLSQDPRNEEVVWPFVTGDEVLSGASITRYVIDFQVRDIVEAKSFRAPFLHVQNEVLPHVSKLAQIEREKTEKLTGQDQGWLKTWWRHFRPRQELIEKIASLGRYIVCSRITKRPIFVFVSSLIRPGDALSCFTLNDDYSFGILQSDTHARWYTAKCSNMKDDPRYTSESVFETFPWPQAPALTDVTAVAKAARDVRAAREKIHRTLGGGPREAHRLLDLPGKNALRDAQAALDDAVIRVYGFSAKKDKLAQLLSLNATVLKCIKKGQLVEGPGIPSGYSNPKALISQDCLAP